MNYNIWDSSQEVRMDNKLWQAVKDITASNVWLFRKGTPLRIGSVFETPKQSYFVESVIRYKDHIKVYVR